MKYIGYYSAAADRKFGHALYSTSDGLTLRITEAVSSADGKPTSKWNDLICVGPIEKCIQPNKISFEASLEELSVLVNQELTEQKSCQKQFLTTGKCFCFTCPVKNKSN